MRDVRAEHAYQFWYFDLSSYISCRSVTIPVTNATDWVSSLHYSLTTLTFQLFWSQGDIVYYFINFRTIFSLIFGFFHDYSLFFES
jgi:hypothetical protein